MIPLALAIMCGKNDNDLLHIIIEMESLPCGRAHGV